MHTLKDFLTLVHSVIMYTEVVNVSYEFDDYCRRAHGQDFMGEFGDYVVAISIAIRLENGNREIREIADNTALGYHSYRIFQRFHDWLYSVNENFRDIFGIEIPDIPPPYEMAFAT